MFRHYANTYQHVFSLKTAQDIQGQHGCVTLGGEVAIFSSQVSVRHALGLFSDRDKPGVLAISRSFVGILKVTEKGEALEGKETKGDILEIAKVEGVTFENKKIKIKGSDGTALLFKWEKGNPKFLENAIRDSPAELEKGRDSKSAEEKFGLTNEDLDALKAQGRIEDFQCGEKILEDGVVMQELLVVIQGDYEIVHDEEKGERECLSDTFIGEISYMWGCLSSETIHAGKNGCTVIRVPYSVIISSSRRSPLFLSRLYQSFLIQLQKRVHQHQLEKEKSQEPSIVLNVSEPVKNETAKEGTATGFLQYVEHVPETEIAKGNEVLEKPEKRKRRGSRLFESKSPLLKSRNEHKSSDDGKPQRRRSLSGSLQLPVRKVDSGFVVDEETKGTEFTTSFIASLMNPTGADGGEEAGSLDFGKGGGEEAGFLDFVDGKGPPLSKELASGFLETLCDVEERKGEKATGGGFYDSLVDPLSEAAGHSQTETFTNLDASLSLHRSAVIGFQLDEMMYATQITELCQWRDTYLKEVKTFTQIIDNLYNFHDLLVVAAWSHSIAEIDKIFRTLDWEDIYLNFHLIYPEIVAYLSNINISILERERIMKLLALPLKRLNYYFVFYGNLFIKEYKEISGSDIQSHMENLQRVIKKC
eukprot:CAMPEP_0201538122 /NCGR_PEP_ID=MMETSP0161_2-20130828/66714_1 /ASSEMBLY_ACC=CAM_ASM_000251 /TAXON_ID=180227 /ORGANISM="Neoparamoeba aestuarina, Strain SoJaBio B1-5/56/2" /LENGTH=644 /DNA_ID=CAMNT_0047944801 /DNA_START=129 /DNA_END=2060 /DNA_ORIENTATION=-